jgi:predicted outer membrane lipoprotein
MNEVWKKIPGWENYEASNLGRIRSFIVTKNSRLMKQHTTRFGYKSLHLRKDKEPKGFLVHRLIAAAFGILNSLDDPLYVNHIDGDKGNNNVSNLERVTRSQNEKHAFKIGLKSHKGEKHNQAKLNRKQVVVIRKKLIRGEAASAIAKEFGISRHTVYGIKQYRSWRDVRV